MTFFTLYDDRYFLGKKILMDESSARRIFIHLILIGVHSANQAYSIPNIYD